MRVAAIARSGGRIIATGRYWSIGMLMADPNVRAIRLGWVGDPVTLDIYRDPDPAVSFDQPTLVGTLVHAGTLVRSVDL